ncbi:hypothetical protein ABH899_002735 [Paenibacillus sp. RC84]
MRQSFDEFPAGANARYPPGFDKIRFLQAPPVSGFDITNPQQASGQDESSLPLVSSPQKSTANAPIRIMTKKRMKIA